MKTFLTLGSSFLFHTEMKTSKTLFNSAIPTEIIQTKMKRTQNSIIELFLTVEIAVKTNLNYSQVICISSYNVMTASLKQAKHGYF